MRCGAGSWRNFLIGEQAGQAQCVDGLPEIAEASRDLDVAQSQRADDVVVSTQR